MTHVSRELSEAMDKLIAAHDKELMRWAYLRGSVRVMATRLGVDLGKDMVGDDMWSWGNVERVLHALERELGELERLRQNEALVADGWVKVAGPVPPVSVAIEALDRSALILGLPQ